MRIALFTETYLPHINGVVTHVKSLKDGLEHLGHEVLIVTAAGGSRRHLLSDGVLYCPAFTSKRFYGYGVAMPLSSTRMRYIHDFKPDIIHVHQEFGIGLSGMLIAKMLRIPLVYTLHTMYDEYIYYVAPEQLAPVTNKFSHEYIKMFGKAAQALTGPSKKCEEYFRKVGVYNKPVNVIPNPVDLDLFRPDAMSAQEKKALREKLGYDDKTLLGVFVGRLGREKSVDVLLDYWKAQIKPEENIRLMVVGDGPCREELMEQAKALGIEGQIAFTGKVPHEEMPPYLGICDFYITASTSDTNSISMLEGMASGLPVLQITDPLNAGQVCDGVNGFIFDNAQEMADEIRLLSAMPPQTLRALRESARRSVENSGSVDLANYVLKVYRDALREKDRHHRLFRLTRRRTTRTLKRLKRLKPADLRSTLRFKKKGDDVE